MPADGFYLSDADKRAIKKLIDDSAQRRVNSPTRDPLTPAPTMSGVYIGINSTANAEIPAMSVVSTNFQTGSATCKLYTLEYNSSTSEYDIEPLTYPSSAAVTATVHNISAVPIPYGFFLVHHEKGGRYVAIPECKPLVRFELKYTLTHAATSQDAYLIDSAGSRSTATYTVHDSPIGQFYGPAGAYGWATYQEDANRFEIVFLNSPARWITFTLTEDMGDTTANRASIGSPGYTYWGSSPGGIDVSPTHVYDPLVRYADAVSGDKGVAVYQEKTDTYDITEIEQAGAKAHWGKCYTDAVFTNDPPTITVKACEDEDGTNPTGDEITIQLPEATAGNILIEEDDVIAYIATNADDTYVCVSAYTGGGGGATWVRAYQQWTSDGTNCYVMCYACDEDGDNEVTDTDLKVWLIKTAGLDPNISIDDVFLATPAEGGNYKFDGSLDGKIDCSVEMTLDSSARNGWELLSETDDKVIRGAGSGESPLDTGGDDVVDIKDHDALGDHADHDDHAHVIGCTNAGYESGSSSFLELESGVTGGAVETTTPFDPVSLDHDAHDAISTHKDSTDGDISNVPAYVAFNFQKRIDNSQGGYPEAEGASGVADPQYNVTIDPGSGKVSGLPN